MLPRVRRVLAQIVLAGAALAAPAVAQQSFDLLLRGGTVVDGTGAEPRTADVGIRDDRVAAIGDLTAATANTVIDAAGLLLAPGFVDCTRMSTPTSRACRAATTSRGWA